MKHHYIPKFYLRQWCDNGKLVEFSRPYGPAVKPRRTSPGGTGYIDNLYALNGAEPSLIHAVEQMFMKATDDSAAKALHVLLSGKQPRNSGMRSGWSRFILSLLLRNPEHIAWMRSEMAQTWKEGVEKLRTDYPNMRQAGDPPTFEEFMKEVDPIAADKAALILAQRVIDSRTTGTVLNNMVWLVLDLSVAQYPLLTSDRPVIMTRGLKHPQSHVALPISPNKLFVAVKSQEVVRQVLHSLDRRTLARDMNRHVIGQAQKYAWGTDDRQLRFVNNHLSRTQANAPSFVRPSLAGSSIAES